MKIGFLLVFCCLLLTGCSHDRLAVFNEYLLPERLACYHVGTPDPEFYCPPVGQRLTIQWSLYRDICNYKEMSLRIWIRYRNHTENTEEIPIPQANGMFTIDLIRREFFETGGMLAYKIQLIGDGEVIDEWQHTLWVELIKFTDENNDSGQNNDDEL